MKELLTNEHFWTIVVGTVMVFFFGKTGILQKWFDNIFISRKSKREKVESLEEKEKEKIEAVIAAKHAENESLRKEVSELKTLVQKMDKDLAQNNIYLKTLLLILEKNMPEGIPPFIVAMTAEIRKNAIHD